MIEILKLCPYCIDEIRRGIPEDGKCGHEALLRADAREEEILASMDAGGQPIVKS